MERREKMDADGFDLLAGELKAPETGAFRLDQAKPDAGSIGQAIGQEKAAGLKLENGLWTAELTAENLEKIIEIEREIEARKSEIEKRENELYYDDGFEADEPARGPGM